MSLSDAELVKDRSSDLARDAILGDLVFAGIGVAFLKKKITFG